MSWFTENPWPPIFILGLVAAGCLAFWSSQKRGVWLIGAIAAIAAGLAVYFVEQSIETEGERVAKNIYALADAFTKKDRDQTLAYFSPQAPELRAMCETALHLAEFPEGIDIKDVQVKMSNENTRAVAHFRANGVVADRSGAKTRIATRWLATWQKEAGRWKIVEVQRLHPYKDEPMGTFDPRQN